MSNTASTSTNESAHDLFDRWLAHHEQESNDVGDSVDEVPDGVDHREPEADQVDEPDEVIETDAEFEEFAHPAPTLGGAAAAPSSHLGPETTGGPEPLPASTRSPVTAGASVPTPLAKPPTDVRRPTAAPAPGLVLFSPRSGVRHILTVLVLLLAVGAGIAGYLSWQAQTPTPFGITGGLVAALVLVWKLRTRTTGTQITVGNGMLKIAQGDNRHQFPLVGAHRRSTSWASRARAAGRC